MEVHAQTDFREEKIQAMETIEDSEIQKMFAGSTILITGGTGFLGKLLVEKLLRCCPKIKKLYLLTRSKKNKSIAKRIQEQFDDLLYDKLRKVMPCFIEKIGIIEGDMALPNMGINEDDRHKIINEVEFIFHGAATVRFDEPLKKAVEINVRGTREILCLARACTKLRAHVHISTAYSNCTSKEVEEKFYDCNLSGDKLIDLIENMDEKTIEDITAGLIGEYPNTYAYTKSAAEDLVLKHSQGLPIAVYRPSIVISTAHEPVPGWIENVYGPGGIVLGAAVGLIHVMNVNPSMIADLVPGDFVVNGCIAIAWKTAKEYPANYEEAPVNVLPRVYNYVSSEQVPLTWKKFMKYSEEQGVRVPVSQAIWTYLLLLIPSKPLYKCFCVLLHWLPAYFIDFILVVIGKKPLLRKAYTKIEKFIDVVAFFTLRQWKFHNQNTLSLYDELSEKDKQFFNFDIHKLKWEEYFPNHFEGIRLYLLKDPLDNVPASKKKYFKLLLIHYFLLSLICFGLLKFMWVLVNLVI